MQLRQRADEFFDAVILQRGDRTDEFVRRFFGLFQAIFGVFANLDDLVVFVNRGFGGGLNFDQHGARIEDFAAVEPVEHVERGRDFADDFVIEAEINMLGAH